MTTKEKKIKAARAVWATTYDDWDASDAARSAAWDIYVAAIVEANKPSKKKVKKEKS